MANQSPANRLIDVARAFTIVLSILVVSPLLFAQQSPTSQPVVELARQGAPVPNAQVQNAQFGTKQPPQPPKPTVVLKPGEVPGIKFDGPIFDFGRVKSGQQILHDFWFTNTGTGPLEVTSVRPGCGCTTAGQHDRVVQPGKTGKIPMKLATTHYSGNVTKSITVTTNCAAPQEATITLQLKGELWQPVQVAPMSASFGRVPQQSKDEGMLVRKLTIVNNMEVKAKIDHIRVPNDTFKAEARELEAGKKFELTVSLVSPLKPGPIYGNIEMATGVPELPILKVPVNAFIVADVDVTPNQLTLPLNRPAALQRQLYVRNNVQTPVKVSDLKCTNPAIKLALSETQPGVAFLITVDVPVDYKTALGGDRITFKTDYPTLPIVTVPIVEILATANRPMVPTSGPALGMGTRAPNAIPITPQIIKPGDPKEGHSGHAADDHSGHSHATGQTAPPAKAPGK